MTVIPVVAVWLAVVQAGEPETTPPTLKRRPADFEACYPSGTGNRIYSARIVLDVTIAPDGRLTHVESPGDVPAWIGDLARCAVQKLEFGPGKIGGVPVESRARVPVVLRFEGPASLEQPAIAAPRLQSSETDIEAAYGGCYPADANATVLVKYRIDVGVDGRVRRASVLGGSGDRTLDKAGICVLKRLRFSPPVRGSQAVRAEFEWNFVVRPPTP